MPATRRPLPTGSGARSFLRRPGGSGAASFLRKPRAPPLRIAADGTAHGGGGGGSAASAGGTATRNLSAELVWAGPDGPAAYAAFHATSLRAPVLCPAEFGTRAKWAVDVFSLPHNAVRRELMDLFKMMADAALLGTALTAAHVREVAAWWKVFHDFYLEVRGLEAGVILPWVGAARGSALDLGYFLEALAEQRELLERLRTDAHAAFRRLYAALDPDGAAPNSGGWVSAPLASSVTSPGAGGGTPGGTPLPFPSVGVTSPAAADAGAAAAAADAADAVPPPAPAADGGSAPLPPPSPPTVASLTVTACMAAVTFASKLVEYFGAQERFLPPVVHRHYADAKEKRRLTAKMVDALLGGRLPKDGVVLLVAWMDDVPALNAFLAHRHQQPLPRGAPPLGHPLCPRRRRRCCRAAGVRADQGGRVGVGAVVRPRHGGPVAPLPAAAGAR